MKKLPGRITYDIENQSIINLMYRGVELVFTIPYLLRYRRFRILLPGSLYATFRFLFYALLVISPGVLFANNLSCDLKDPFLLTPIVETCTFDIGDSRLNFHSDDNLIFVEKQFVNTNSTSGDINHIGLTRFFEYPELYTSFAYSLLKDARGAFKNAKNFCINDSKKSNVSNHKINYTSALAMPVVMDCITIDTSINYLFVDEAKCTDPFAGTILIDPNGIYRRKAVSSYNV